MVVADIASDPRELNSTKIKTTPRTKPNHPTKERNLPIASREPCEFTGLTKIDKSARASVACGVLSSAGGHSPYTS